VPAPTSGTSIGVLVNSVTGFVMPKSCVNRGAVPVIDPPVHVC
jgi:hypothetical protein